MSLDLSSTKYSKSAITDIALITNNNEILWYSKYQLSKISPVFAATFLGDSSVRELIIDYETTIISLMLDYTEGKKFIHKDIDIKPFLIDLYKISHYYNYSTLENYITDEILEYSITDEILVLFKTYNNKKYITAVENRMTNGELKHDNCNINSDMIEIYRHVLDVAQRIVKSINVYDNNQVERIDNNAYRDELLTIKEALSTIPGIKDGYHTISPRETYLHFNSSSSKNLIKYDTRRNYYNHKKKNVNIQRISNGDRWFVAGKDTFYISNTGLVTHKYDVKIYENGDLKRSVKIPITEEDKIILSQYHEVWY